MAESNTIENTRTVVVQDGQIVITTTRAASREDLRDALKFRYTPALVFAAAIGGRFTHGYHISESAISTAEIERLYVAAGGDLACIGGAHNPHTPKP